MNYRASIVLGALLALGISACDPYEDENGGAPAIIGVTLSEGSTATEVTQADATGAWAISGEDSAQNVLFVLTNTLLDGASIQTSPSDCTPAGNWLTVTGPALTCETGTPAWYTCYVPSSPQPGQGGSIAVFQSCEAPSLDGGWFDIGELAPSSTYRFTGEVRGGNGAALPIDVTVNTAAAPPPTTPAT